MAFSGYLHLYFVIVCSSSILLSVLRKGFSCFGTVAFPGNFVMPPSSKKLKGILLLGRSSVRPFVHPSVRSFHFLMHKHYF